jgi:hypothetical protein
MTLTFTDARIAAMLDGRGGVHRVPFPGLKGANNEVGIRVLSSSEDDAARSEALRMFIAQCEFERLDWRIKKVVDEEAFDQIVERCIVQRAVVQAEPDKEGNHAPFFPGISAVLQFKAEVIGVLYDAYLAAKELTEPDPLTQVEHDAIIEALKKTEHPKVLLLAYRRSTLQSLLLTTLGLQSET